MAIDPDEAERLAKEQPKMMPWLIKGAQSEYVVEPWTGSDTSGLRVFSGHVLVLMDLAARETSGGILMVDERTDRMDEASITGRIYNMGPEAFQTGRYGGAWQGERPTIGERVYVEKYAGVKATGLDGRVYRIMEDTCIACVISDDATKVEG